MDSSTARAYAVGAVTGLAVSYAIYAAHRRCGAPPGPQGAPVAQRAAPLVAAVRAQDLDDEILSEQFTRNVQFFGKEGQQKVSEAYVVVVGLGGVGSHAAHLLLRSGVGHLKLVDFDQVRSTRPTRTGLLRPC